MSPCLKQVQEILGCDGQFTLAGYTQINIQININTDKEISASAHTRWGLDREEMIHE